MQAYGKIECDTGKNGEAEPMIVEKRAKALPALAQANPREMAKGEHGSNGKPAEIDPAHREAQRGRRVPPLGVHWGSNFGAA